MRATTFLPLLLALTTAAACSKDDDLDESHPPDAIDTGVATDSIAASDARDSATSDTASADTAVADSIVTTDSGVDSATPDAATDTASDVPFVPAVPESFLIIEVAPGEPGATNVRADFIRDRSSGLCREAYAGAGTDCILRTCGTGTVTRIASGDITIKSGVAGRPEIKMSPGTDGVYAPVSLALQYWSGSGTDGGFEWSVNGPGGLAPPAFGGVSLAPRLPQVTAPTVASLAGGIDRAADFDVMLGASFPAIFLVQLLPAGTTEGTATTTLRCTFGDAGRPSTSAKVPSAALQLLPAGSYRLVMGGEIESTINAGDWKHWMRAQTVARDAAGTPIAVNVNLR
jgi:hypothetical protein